MTDLAWMKTYIGDEAALTGHLSAEEFGAYERLRRHYWQHGSLPDDDTRLMRITGIDAGRWEAVCAAIASLFADGWRLPRLDQERSEAVDKRERKVAAGRKGTQSRWAGVTVDSKANAVANGKGNGSANAVANAEPLATSTRTSKDIPFQRKELSRTHARAGETAELASSHGTGNAYARAKAGL